MTNDDENYRRQEAVFDRFRDLEKAFISTQAEYGKWLINTLWLLHSGSIVGLLFKHAGANPPPYLNALWWFVIGIILAFGSGFATWLNFTVAANVFGRVLSDPERVLKVDTRDSCRIKLTLWLAVASGILSVACLVIGALAVWCTWKA